MSRSLRKSNKDLLWQLPSLLASMKFEPAILLLEKVMKTFVDNHNALQSITVYVAQRWNSWADFVWTLLKQIIVILKSVNYDR